MAGVMGASRTHATKWAWLLGAVRYSSILLTDISSNARTMAPTTGRGRGAGRGELGAVRLPSLSTELLRSLFRPGGWCFC